MPATPIALMLAAAPKAGRALRACGLRHALAAALP
jgi:hypothetical protein